MKEGACASLWDEAGSFGGACSAVVIVLLEKVSYEFDGVTVVLCED